MSAYTIQRSSVVSGRQLVLVVVVGLHALAIGGLMTMKIAFDQPPPPQAFKPVTSIDPPPPQPQPRPQLEPDEITLQWAVPSPLPPDIPFEDYRWVPPDIGTTIDLTGLPGPGVATDADGISEIPATELSYRATRSPDDYYPAVSLQLQEQGTSVVRVCVAPTGRLEGMPVIERSSGSRRLDTAAIQWAREALAFTPATRNGAAVAACKGFRVNFKLR